MDKRAQAKPLKTRRIALATIAAAEISDLLEAAMERDVVEDWRTRAFMVRANQLAYAILDALDDDKKTVDQVALAVNHGLRRS